MKTTDNDAQYRQAQHVSCAHGDEEAGISGHFHKI
jgi:hypothetical protein